MTEKALVAVNDSEAALNAFLQTVELSRRFGFQLGAVCVAPPYQGDLALVGVHALKRTLAEPSLTVLDEAVRIATEEGVGLSTFTAEGDRPEAIIDLAVKERYDLITIGQEPGMCLGSVGSLTAGLLHHSPVDLLIIPKNRPVRLDRVLHVLNGSQPVSPASRLMKGGDRSFGQASPGVRSPTVDRSPQGANGRPIVIDRDSLRNPSKECLPETAPAEVVTRERSPRRILEFSRKTRMDMIVWEDGGPREPAWFSWLGTRAFRLVRRSRWPVWIMKA
ncbi:MAG: universal stress protein [Hyphomicrobiales bacterium]